MTSSVSAQNVQHTSKSADLGLRSDFKVNPSTHGLELQLPLGAYTGRAGNSLPVTLSYSSKLWRVKYAFYEQNSQRTGVTALYSGTSASGWTSSLGVPVIDGETGTEYYDFTGQPVGTCRVGGQDSSTCCFIDRMMLRMPDGSSHELRSSDTPICYNTNGTSSTTPPDDMYSVDGSHVRYRKSTRELFLPDGSRYVWSADFTAVQYTDRNGNTLSYSGGQWTDTLGRTIPQLPLSTTVGNPTYSLPGVGGNRTYTFRWRNLNDTGVLSPGQEPSYISNEDCPSTGQTYEHHLFSGCYAGNHLFNPVVLYQIVLPTGQAYTFNYNAYGEIDKVTYPTGGYERYEYGSTDTPSGASSPYGDGNRGVTNRYISPTGLSTDEIHWQYDSGGTGSYSFNQFIQREIAPDGTRTERLMYRDSNGSFGYSYDGARAGMAYEERVISASGQMLRRKLTEWTLSGTSSSNQFVQQATRDPRVTKEVEILLDTGTSNALTKTTTFAYDADFNLKATTSYDYVSIGQATAQTAGIASFTAGTPLRTQETVYLVNDPAISATTRQAYRDRNLLVLPSVTRVRQGGINGTVIAETRLSYDQYDQPNLSLLTYSTVTGWTDPQSNYRGNVTTTASWLDTTGTYIETHARYDQCGNVRSAWDAKGNQSQVDYTDSFSNNEPGHSTYAYPTATTSAIPDSTETNGSNSALTAHTQYHYGTGLVMSTTDANGQAMSFDYSDPLNRLKTVTRPTGGGSTTYCSNLFL